jgi:F-type H+-transporting ATPase subunit gamma
METRRDIKNAVLLVLTSNRGLCGGYNASILREAGAAIQRLRSEGIQLHLEISGKRGIAYYRYQGIAAAHTYTQFEDKPTFDEVEVLANRYIADYIAGKIDRVDVVYMKFLSASRQAPVVETLLPLGTSAPAQRQPAPASSIEYEFLPGAKDILEEILPISFKIRLFKCFLDAAVSEQIARRVAMKAATENAADMIKTLTSQYNRARQSQITSEIAEIIGGAAALE